jgi:hypothetical protein
MGAVSEGSQLRAEDGRRVLDQPSAEAKRLPVSVRGFFLCCFALEATFELTT